MKLDRSLLTIFLAVVCLHAGLIVWAMTTTANAILVAPTPPLVVKTITLSPPAAMPQPVAPALTQPKVVTKAALPPKKTLERPKPVSKPVVKSEPAVKQEAKQDTVLLNKAKEALRNLKAAPALKPTRELAFSDPVSAPSSPNYDQELVQRLHKLLRLPEYGEIAIQLTLNRDGTVDKVEIIAAESETNKLYIQKQLPTLRFLTFGKQFPNEKQHTFMLVLKNE